MAPMISIATALSLLWAVGLSRASDSLRGCDESKGLCLDTFRWCDIPSCRYPIDIKPIFYDDSYAAGYGMLRFDELYYVLWKTPAWRDEVYFRWVIGGLNDKHPTVEWTRNTTDSNVAFRANDVIKEILDSGKYNVTDSDLRVMMSGIGNTIYISQGDPFHPKNPTGSIVQTGNFTVQNDEAWRAVDAGEKVGAAGEKWIWTLGVGIGVGIGAPLLMTVTGLTTWWLIKRQMAAQDGVKLL